MRESLYPQGVKGWSKRIPFHRSFDRVISVQANNLDLGTSDLPQLWGHVGRTRRTGTAITTGTGRDP